MFIYIHFVRVATNLIWSSMTCQPVLAYHVLPEGPGVELKGQHSGNGIS